MIRTPRLYSLVFVGLLAGATAAQTTHVVTASGFSFVPSDITIRKGDTVRWVNLQGMSHNVAEVDCPEGPTSVYNGGFFSGFGGDVPEFEVTFNDAGEACYVCEPHVTFSMTGHITIEEVWTDLGGGSPGVAGTPALTADGPLTAGSTLSLGLTNAAPSALMVFWLALTPTPPPFAALGGTVHAFPFNLQVIRTSSAGGTFNQSLPWPAGIPAGIDLTMQFLIQDASVADGIVLSNGVTASTP